MAGDEISADTRLMAARVRERAAAMPTAAEIADMTTAALMDPGRQMSAAEIRQLFSDAITQVQQVSYYLGVLAGRLGDPAGET